MAGIFGWDPDEQAGPQPVRGPEWTRLEPGAGNPTVETRRILDLRQGVLMSESPGRRSARFASLADRHFRISKEAGSELAETRVKHLGDEEVIEELCRMLGAEGSDLGARRHAEALLGLTPA